MSDPDAIRSAVVNDATMDGLMAGRIYPLVLPPGDVDLPAITYGLVSQPTMVSQDVHEYRSPRWRFRIWSLVYADLIPIAQGLAAIFGNQSVTPFPSSRIEYPASQAEGHEKETHRYWRALDVVVGLAPAGSASQ